MNIGFIINPCDPCVANKMINGKQMTICWHSNDLKMSHAMPKVQDKMIKCLRHQEHESMFEDGSGAMTVSRGEIHTYLGMKLDFTIAGQVAVTMFDHLDNTLSVFEEGELNGGGTKSSAAPMDLFTVNQDCEKLADDKAMEFHNIVAKTLYVTKRARPDTPVPLSPS
jgi:hypothetical protein